jgi:hypothetical protein
MADFSRELTDRRTRPDLEAALDGAGDVPRFQATSSRHVTYRVRWRVSFTGAAPAEQRRGSPTRATTQSPDPLLRV